MRMLGRVKLGLMAGLMLCLGALAADQAEMIPGESLLLYIRPNVIEPVAIRGKDGRFREVPMDEQTGPIQKIVKSLFSKGKSYEMYANGLPSGVFNVAGYIAAGCSGFGVVEGTIRPPLPKHLTEGTDFARFVGFTQDFPGKRTYEGGSGRSGVTATIREQALNLSKNVYESRGLEPEKLKRLQLDDVQVLRLGQGKIPGLMVATRIQEAPGENTGCHSEHLLIVAEAKGKTYVPRLELYKKATQAEGPCSGHSYISSFNAEAGSEYLLIEGWGYEWNWYEIHRRKPDGSYEEVFSGGGGGC